MQLTNFRITNYRSVNDSGWIDVAQMTAIVGRNESGKSNILLALESLNPPDGPKTLTLLKDFPRDRPRGEFSDDVTVVETIWTLDHGEQAAIDALGNRPSGITKVKVSRGYSPDRFVDLLLPKPEAIPVTELKRKLRGLEAKVEASTEGLANGAALTSAWSAFRDAVQDEAAARAEWAVSTTSASKAFRRALAAADIALGTEETKLDEIEDLAILIEQEGELKERTQRQILDWMPTFIYVADQSDVSGHTDVADYVNHRPQRQTTGRDLNFAKLCKVAGLVPRELLNADHESRMQMNNRAGAVVTERIRDLWSDRRLKIRFNMDGPHFDTLVSDPNNEYDVEVNLDERSRGLRWFVSFFVTYLADTDDGPAANAVLLLDEPGLFLHAGSQRDLLKFLRHKIPVQSIFTTHSPFMVPPDGLDAVRTVSIDQDRGTTVSNDPSGDAKTLFPIQAALGYDLAQSLFVGSRNLIVEGVTDFWILSAVSNHLKSVGRVGLSDDVTITPAGGAQKVSYMASLLVSQSLHVVVLLDDENKARATGKDLKNLQLVDDRSVVFVTEAFRDDRPHEADVEDLIGAKTYTDLATSSHSDMLMGRDLALEERVPRIVRRLDAGFEALGLKFNKTKAARLLLRQLAQEGDAVLTADALDRFETLFKRLNPLFPEASN